MDLLQSILGSPIAISILAIGTALGSLAGGLRLVNAISEFRSKRQAKKLGEELRRSSGVASFTDADIQLACKNYVPPHCTQTDPSDEDDLRNVVALAPLFESVDRHLGAGGEKRHMMLLADSGMGKTTFCINYYARHALSKKSLVKNIAIVPLGRANALKQIEELPDKRNTVLLLDAFDEDPGAIGREGDRLVELMRAASDFRNVLITCRSQFFSNDDAIPKGSGVMYASSRRAGQGREFPLHKLFLAPLTKEQVEKYIAHRFPYSRVRNWGLRSKARSLVRDIPELSVRPMLLELLPDLVGERKRIEQLFDLYEFLISKWLDREKEWISETKLFDISVELAVRIFVSQRRGLGDRISPERLEKIANDFDASIEGWRLKSRSLLNRDIEGNFKFAHRSVMEYLFLYAALSGDERCFEVEWTDFIKDLLVSFGNSRHSKISVDIDEFLGKAKLKTGLWPLATPLRLPRRVGRREITQILKSDSISSRHSRKIPAAWRHGQTKITKSGRADGAISYSVSDVIHGIEWSVTFARPEDFEIYAEPYFSPALDAEISRDGRVYTKRLPSLDEMISLWEGSNYARLSGIDLLLENAIYWVGDSGDTGPLCCSVGSAPVDLPYLAHIESKADTYGRPLHIYEFGNRYGVVGKQPFRALGAHVIEEKKSV